MSRSKSEQALVFDLDGTLYRFEAGSFEQSALHDRVQERKEQYFADVLGVETPRETMKQLREEYGEDTSIAVEEAFDADREKYFEYVWNIDPEGVIDRNGNVEAILKDLDGKKAILTTAPAVWAENVLRFLGVTECFQYIKTGEGDIRKPSAEAYQQVIDELGVSFSDSYMVGDQEHHDIVPANELGLTTIYIGEGETTADHQIEQLEEVKEIV